MIDRIDGPEVRGFAARAWRTHLDRDVEPETLRRELSSGTLVAAIHATAGRVPDRPALEIDGARMTHGELDERAGRFAGWLRAKAVHAGERVMLVAPNTLETVMAYLGVLRAGATVVLASPALTAPERDRILRRSRATALLGPGASDGRAGAARSGRILRCELTGLADDRSELGQAVAGAPPIRPPTGGPAGRPTLLAFSSGTTGRPKAVPLSDGNLLSSIRAAMLAWRWTDDDVLVHSLPISHQHGLSGVHATLLAGSAAVILPAFDADALCGAVARSRATVLFAVPTIYERLLASGAIARADLGSLRLLVSGSAPLSPRLAERIRGAVGDLPLERYGTTESGLNVSNPYVGARQAGSVGLPLPGVELAIVGRHGAPVEEGRTGEIVIRGPQVFEGYDGGDAGHEFFPGGWFRTGDLGRLEPPGGQLRITGRTKDLIISGGLNVYPREVELVLEEAPGVVRAAVVGVPSDRWGEEVAAAVVPAAGRALDAAELLAFVRSRLAAYKCPKRIVVVERLPVSSTGKVVKSEIRRLIPHVEPPAGPTP